MVVFFVQSPLDKLIVDDCLSVLGKVCVSLRFDRYPSCRANSFHMTFSTLHLLLLLSNQMHVCPSYPLNCVVVVIGLVHNCVFLLVLDKHKIALQERDEWTWKAPRNKELWNCPTSLTSTSMVCSTTPRKLYCVQRCSMTSRKVRTCMIPVICPDQMVINDVALFESHRMCPSACKSWQRIPGPNFQFGKLGQHKLSYFQREAVFPNRGRFFSTALFASKPHRMCPSACKCWQTIHDPNSSSRTWANTNSHIFNSLPPCFSKTNLSHTFMTHTATCWKKNHT